MPFFTSFKKQVRYKHPAIFQVMAAQLSFLPWKPVRKMTFVLSLHYNISHKGKIMIQYVGCYKSQLLPKDEGEEIPRAVN